jgi:hypothetical protein
MEIDKTRNLILKTIGIGEKGVDLIDRVLSLEKIDKNVSSVELSKSTVRWTKVSAQVCLKENFSTMDEFKKYADEKGLKGNITIQTGNKNHYLIYNNGVEIEFY